MTFKAALPFSAIQVEIYLDATYSLLSTLSILAVSQEYTCNDWLTQMGTTLDAETLLINRVLLGVLADAVEPYQTWEHFTDYLTWLAQRDPIEMQQAALYRLSDDPGVHAALLADRRQYFLQVSPDKPADEALYGRAHDLLQQPDALKKIALQHLTGMWEAHLAPYWQEHRDLLLRAVRQLRHNRYHNLTAYEAIRQITGRDLSGTWQREFRMTHTIRFIPTYNTIRPYLITYHHPQKPGFLRMVFDASALDLSEDVEKVAHDRSDLLLHLRTLADESRLQIIHLLAQGDELTAQDFANALQLNQSTVSRHLSQLSAMGFIREQQREGKTRYYALNRSTLRELTQHLLHFADAYSPPN